MRSTPKIGKFTYGDALSVGQLATQWGRPTSFVHGLVSQGLLAKDERGLITNTELNRFYKESGTLLDA